MLIRSGGRRAPLPVPGLPPVAVVPLSPVMAVMVVTMSRGAGDAVMEVTMARGPGEPSNRGQRRGAVHQLLQHLRRGHGKPPPLSGRALRLALDALRVGAPEDRGEETGAE